MPADERLRAAREFGEIALRSYWTTLRRRTPMAPAIAAPFHKRGRDRIESGGHHLAVSLGIAAADLDVCAAAQSLGGTYAAMLPEQLRSQLGAYYTPPDVAERLLDMAQSAGIRWDTHRILDPACGGGAFLAPVARRMAQALSNRRPVEVLRDIATRLRGFEIDPFAAWMAQVFTEAALLDLQAAAGERIPVLVSVCDSLADAPDAAFDLVVGNPPYGKVSLDPERRARFGRSLHGHANLYGLFTDLALRHCGKGGVVAYVTPTSFLGGEYFKRLRELLAAEAPPLAIDFISTRQGVFDGVLQETLLATFKRGARASRVTLHSTRVSSDARCEVSRIGDVALEARRSGPWLLPRSTKQVPLVERLRCMPMRLADWGYSVSTGPLVWNRHKTQLRPTAGERTVPLVWAESVGADGKFTFKAERRHHTPFFRLRPGDDWMLIRERCVLVQRTTAKEQQRRLVAAVLPRRFVREHGGVVVENHLNMLLPHPMGSAVTPALLAAFLNTRAADAAFRCISGSVAVSAFELRSLPLPDAAAVEALAALGRSSDAFEMACAQLYGSSE